MRFCFRNTLWILLFTLTSSTALANEDFTCHSGACFPNSLIQNDKALYLKNTALYRFWGFRVYTAALYAHPSRTPQELFEHPFALSLYYHRRITKNDFKESSYSVLRQNPGFDPVRMGPKLDLFLSRLQDVTEGQVYTLFWDPETGLEIALDGSPKGAIENTELATLYLQIWLSEFSVRPENYRALLAF